MHKIRATHKIRAVVLLLAAALAGGCAQSKVPADAKVTLTGRLLRPDGSPAAARPLALTRVPDLGEVASQGIPVAATLGAACLADDPPPLCKLRQRTTSDAQGAFTVHMSGSDVRGTFATATNFDLAAQLPRTGTEVDGPSVRTSFQIQRADLTVPTLRFWEPGHVTATGDARKVALDWDRQPNVSDYTMHFAVGGQEIWSDAAAATMDARAFEDAHGVLHLAMTASAPGPDTTFATTYVSQGVAFTGQAGAPESRGRDCYAEGPAGPLRIQPCTLTDGSFDHPLSEPQCANSPCETDNWVYVDLGAPTRIGAVFLRGVPGGPVAVDTSDDAATWRPSGHDTAGTPFVVLNTDVTARYVRVRRDGDARLTGLTQVSVWP
jgi:hypothetical protein